jgi:type IV secretory pathway VirB2 component (pilin)
MKFSKNGGRMKIKKKLVLQAKGKDFLSNIKYKKEKLCVLLLGMFLSPIVLADDGDAVATFVEGLCNLLSGKIARSIGVLAIIFMGYRTLSGRMDWRLAATITIGMGLIIGGAYYGSTLFGS